MNKKVLLQVGCFLMMFALEMVAAYVDPSSALYSVLLVLALLMIPAFVITGRMPSAAEEEIETEEPIAKAA